jgi:hypothetical protein
MRRSGINESSHAGPKSRGSAAAANISKTEHDVLLIGGADPGALHGATKPAVIGAMNDTKSRERIWVAGSAAPMSSSR